MVIPFNAVVARSIGRATGHIAIHRDARVSHIQEALRSIIAMKALCLERLFLRRVEGSRAEEYRFLCRRRAADAVCVFLWAATPGGVALQRPTPNRR